jgi:hypothetical protein
MEMAIQLGEFLTAVCPDGRQEFNAEGKPTFSAVSTKTIGNTLGDEDPGVSSAGVLCGTPGTILRLLEERKLNFSRLQTAIFDDAEQLFSDNGTFRHLDEIREKGFLNSAHHVTILALSGLDPASQARADKFTRRSEPPTIINIRGNAFACSPIKWYNCGQQTYQEGVNKVLNSNLVQSNDKIQIITPHYKEAENVASAVRSVSQAEAERVFLSNARRSPADRLAALAGFRNSQAGYLISNDLFLAGVKEETMVTIFVGVDSLARLSRALHRPSRLFVVVYTNGEREDQVHMARWVANYQAGLLNSVEPPTLPSERLPRPSSQSLPSGKRVLLSNFPRRTTKRPVRAWLNDRDIYPVSLEKRAPSGTSFRVMFASEHAARTCLERVNGPDGRFGVNTVKIHAQFT